MQNTLRYTQGRKGFAGEPIFFAELFGYINIKVYFCSTITVIIIMAIIIFEL